jgi:integrase
MAELRLLPERQERHEYREALIPRRARMTKKKLGSLVYQAKIIMRAGEAFGKSRHQAKRDGTAVWKIFSFGTMKSYLAAFNRFLRFCQSRYGERYAGNVTPDMALAYIRHLGELGRKPDYISKEWAAIKKGDALMRRFAWKAEDAPPLLVDGFGRHSDYAPNPVPSAKITEIIAWLDQHSPDPRYSELARIQQILGLRPTEAIQLRVGAISPNGDQVTLERGDGTKGGRPRIIEVTTPTGQEFLLQLRERGQRNKDRYVFQDRKGLLRVYERWFQRACRAVGLDEQGHTPHDLRSANANEEYARYQQAGLSKRQAERKVSQRLGHQRREVLKRYLSPAVASSDSKEGQDRVD